MSEFATLPPAPFLHQSTDREWLDWFNRLVAAINIRLNAINGIIDDDSVADDFWFNGSKWTNVTASRSGSTPYLNNLGKPIMVSVMTTAFEDNNAQLYISDDNVTYLIQCQTSTASSATYQTYHTIWAVVPNNWYYQVTGGAGTAVHLWSELL